MRVAAPHVMSLSRRAGASAALLMLAALGGCLDLKPKEACSVTVAPTSLSLAVNGSAPIVATAFDCDGNTIRNKKLAYSSSNTAVATVTGEGTVIAVAVGVTTVSAEANGKSASVAVTVTPEAANSVTVTPSTLTLRETNTRQLTAVARNAQGLVISGRTFRWGSSNSAIVSVDQNGNLAAISAGDAVITAEADQATGQALIKVTRIPVIGCRLAPATSKVTVSQSVQPTITLLDSAGTSLPITGRPLVWTSSNEVVATVSQSGLVTTRKAGTTTITAASADNPAANCITTVEAVDARIDKVIIQPKVGSVRLGLSRVMGYGLIDSVGGAIPAGRTVTWRTTEPTVLRVSQLGEVTGLTLGTGRVIVTAEGVSDTATLTVTKIPLSTVIITPLQSTMTEGQTTQLRVTLTDSTGAEVSDRPIEWTTSDPSRATVSQTGLVSAIAAGTVTISAVATQDNRVGQANVIIQQVPVDTIVVADTFTVNMGTSSAFAIQLKDAQGRTLIGRNVLVSSDFPGVAIGQATVTSTQVNVQGISLGTARLTLQAVDSNNRAQGKPSVVVVTVQKPPTPTVRQGSP